MIHLPDLALNPETKLFPAEATFGWPDLAAVASWLSKMVRLHTQRLVPSGPGLVDDSEVTRINLEEMKKPKKL